MILPTTFQEGAGNGLRSDLLYSVSEISLSFCRRQLKNATYRRELSISKNSPNNYCFPHNKPLANLNIMHEYSGLSLDFMHTSSSYSTISHAHQEET